MKNQSGITLIALIITIIVMLILVAVTLSIVLGDNGILNKARTGTKSQTIEQERETLQTAALGAYDEVKTEVDFNELDENLPAGFEGSKGTYTSSTGNIFTVDKYGTIIVGESIEEEEKSEEENPEENSEEETEEEEDDEWCYNCECAKQYCENCGCPACPQCYWCDTCGLCLDCCRCGEVENNTCDCCGGNVYECGCYEYYYCDECEEWYCAEHRCEHYVED